MTILWSALMFLWLLACLVQLHYWLVVVVRLVRHRDSTEEGPAVPVSVVVCTRSVSDVFNGLLADLGSQTYPHYEVIIVNDGPDPEVSRLIDALSDIGPAFVEVPFDYNSKVLGGKKQPLAMGIRASRHDWLLLTDSDCRVGPKWIETMMGCLSKRKRIVLGYGPFNSHSRLSNLVSRLENIMVSIQYLGMALAGKPYMGVGRNVLYRKELFARAGGFDDHLDIISGDDDLFIQQVASPENTTICLNAESYAWSDAQPDLGAFIRQKRRHLSTATRYSPRSKRQLILYNGSFVLFWLIGFLLVVAGETGMALLFAASGMIQWIVFALATGRLGVSTFSWIYPVYAVVYACYLCLAGLFTQLKAPSSWNT